MKNIDLTIIRSYRKVIAAFALVAMVVAGCKDDFTSPSAPAGSTISAVISASSNMKILSAALARTSQGNSLANNNSGTFTVFAPSDSAFLVYFQAKLSKPATFTIDSAVAYINTKLSSSSVITVSGLSSVLTYHIISSDLPKAALVGTQTFATLNGARLSISNTGTQIVLNANIASNGSKAIAFDAPASNGVIHTVNRVLVPVTATTAASLLGISVNYSTTPATITVGATSGSNYDVLAAGIQTAGVAVASLLLPNTSPLPEVTVFAPNDAAFIAYLSAASESDAITKIKAMTPAALATLLTYHIVVGKRILTTDLTDGGKVVTQNGASFVTHTGPPVKITDNNATSNDATIVSANNLTNAGAFHGIDTVLLPQ